MTWVIALSIIIVVGLIVIAILGKRLATPPHKAAGDAGEDAAASVIKRVLHKGDKCFRNVPVLYDGQETELDFLIVNSSGVFIRGQKLQRRDPRQGRRQVLGKDQNQSGRQRLCETHREPYSTD